MAPPDPPRLEGRCFDSAWRMKKRQSFRIRPLGKEEEQALNGTGRHKRRETTTLIQKEARLSVNERESNREDKYQRGNTAVKSKASAAAAADDVMHFRGRLRPVVGGATDTGEQPDPDRS